MEWTLQRRPTAADWMFGDLLAGDFHCHTLEDELREKKVHGETAISADRYEVVMQDSPKFGPDTLTLLDVKGFSYIRIHGLNNDDQTEGCLGVGSRIDEGRGEIYGAKTDKVLDRLKHIFDVAKVRGERVWITIKNAEGDRYVDTGNVAPEA